MSIDKRRRCLYNLQLSMRIAGWCNGSTTDSGSVSLGSSPSPAAMALSSNGSGRRPLTAVIGVRIPLGSPYVGH